MKLKYQGNSPTSYIREYANYRIGLTGGGGRRCMKYKTKLLMVPKTTIVNAHQVFS